MGLVVQKKLYIWVVVSLVIVILGVVQIGCCVNMSLHYQKLLPGIVNVSSVPPAWTSTTGCWTHWQYVCPVYNEINRLAVLQVERAFIATSILFLRSLTCLCMRFVLFIFSKKFHKNAGYMVLCMLNIKAMYFWNLEIYNIIYTWLFLAIFFNEDIFL